MLFVEKGLGRPKEPRDMGEGLLLLPGLTARGGAAVTGELDFSTQSPMKGPPKGSFDDEEVGRDDDGCIMLKLLAGLALKCGSCCWCC